MSLGWWHFQDVARVLKAAKLQVGVWWTCELVPFNILSSSSSSSIPHSVTAVARCGGQEWGEKIAAGAAPPAPPSSPLPSPLPLLRLPELRLLRLRHLLRRRLLLRLWLRQQLYLAMVLDRVGLVAQSRGTTLAEPANL